MRKQLPILYLLGLIAIACIALLSARERIYEWIYIRKLNHEAGAAALRIVDILGSLESRKAVPMYWELLSREEQTIRFEAHRAVLTALQKLPAEAVAVITRDLVADTCEGKELLFEAIYSSKAQSQMLARALTANAMNGKSHCRFLSLLCCVSNSPNKATGLEIASKCLNDESSAVRELACYVIVSLCGAVTDQSNVLRALRTAFGDKEDRVRCAAKAAVAALGHTVGAEVCGELPIFVISCNGSGSGAVAVFSIGNVKNGTYGVYRNGLFIGKVFVDSQDDGYVSVEKLYVVDGQVIAFGDRCERLAEL